MVVDNSYYARRYRTLFEPNALDFSSKAPRPAAAAAVYSRAPTLGAGLPRAARSGRGVLPLVIPVLLATVTVTYFENKLNNQRGSVEQDLRSPAAAEASRRKAMEDAYGDRASLERLAEVINVYETTKRA